MWSLSHQNATCNFLGGKLKYFDRCKKASRTTNVAYKCYTYFHFHQQSTIISFHMKIGKHTCYTNKNIYEKNSEFLHFMYYLFWIYCSLGSICTQVPKRPSLPKGLNTQGQRPSLTVSAPYSRDIHTGRQYQLGAKLQSLLPG